MTTATKRSLRLHGPHGIVEPAAEKVAERGRGRRVRTIANKVPITAIMSRNVVCALPDLGVDKLLELMVEERLGCVPVVDEHGHPLGMVTKLDIVEYLVSPAALAATVASVMMPLAITLDDDATVAHAAALMACEGMHHVMILSGQRLVGVVSTMDITRWLSDNDGSPHS